MKHILVIEDTPSIGEMLQDFLASEGYRTTCKTTGNDALNYITDIAPDLILLDVFLDRGYDGRDICRTLQENTRLKHIPVVMFSANHQLKDIISKSCSPQAFINKPFDLFNLLDIIANQLQKVN